MGKKWGKSGTRFLKNYSTQKKKLIKCSSYLVTLFFKFYPTIHLLLTYIEILNPGSRWGIFWHHLNLEESWIFPWKTIKKFFVLKWRNETENEMENKISKICEIDSSCYFTSFLVWTFFSIFFLTCFVALNVVVHVTEKTSDAPLQISINFYKIYNWPN